MPVALFVATKGGGEKNISDITIRPVENGFSVDVSWVYESVGPEGRPSKDYSRDSFVFNDTQRLSKFVFGLLEKFVKKRDGGFDYSPSELFDDSDEIKAESLEEDEEYEQPSGTPSGNKRKA